MSKYEKSDTHMYESAKMQGADRFFLLFVWLIYTERPGDR